MRIHISHSGNKMEEGRKYTRVLILFTIVIVLNANAALQEVGTFNTMGTAMEIAVRGDYAYLVDFDGLYTFDITDPASPDSIHYLSAPLPEWSTIELQGDYAYLTCTRGGLHIIDISVPYAPEYDTTYSRKGGADDAVIMGDYAYVSFTTYGLVVIDITDSMDPVEVAQSDPPGGTAIAIDVSDTLAFVAYGTAGIRIFDITDVLEGSFGNFDTDDVIGDIDIGTSTNVKFDGTYLHSTWGTGGYSVIDVSDPTNPFELATNNTPGSSKSVDVVGDYAYVADESGGLRVFDISQLDTITSPPYSLTESDHFPATPNETYNNARASGMYVYISDLEDGIRVIEAADYPSLVQKSIARQKWELLGIPTTVVDGDAEILFQDDFNNQPAGVPNWRISRWDDANQKYTRYGETDNPDVGGNQDPADFVPGLGYWVLQNSVDNCILKIDVDQNTGIVAQTSRYSVSLSDGRDPRSYTQLANPFHYPYDLYETYFSNNGGTERTANTIANDSSYINGNVYMWDTENSQYATSAFSDIIPAWEGFWVIQTNPNVILDILFTPDGYVPAAPPRPKEGGTLKPFSFSTDEWAMRLTVETSDGLYKDSFNKIGVGFRCAEDYDPLDAFELTPMSDSFVQLYFPHEDWDVQPGRYTNDLRAPGLETGKTWEFVVRSFNLPGHEFILNWPELLNIPAEVKLSLEDLDDGDFMENIKGKDGYIFRSDNSNDSERRFALKASIDGESGSSIVSDFRLISVYPNPFNSSARINFGLDQSQVVSLKAYDILGKELSLIEMRPFATGNHEIIWNASELPSGMYLLKLEAGGRTQVKSAAIIR